MSVNSITSSSTYYQSLLTTKSSNSANTDITTQSADTTVATGSTSSTNPANSSSATTTNTQTATATTSSKFTTPTKWGFSVNENGYFGVDFNKAAGLPENMKINQKMMDMASDYSQARGDNIDPLTIVSKVWNLYKTVAGSSLDHDGDGFMTPEEVDKMPKGYTSKGSILDGIVSTTPPPMHNIRETMPLLMTAGFSPDSGHRMFSGGIYGSNMLEECSRIYESYTDTPYEGKKDDGTIPVGELFGEFFFTNVDNETQELKPNPNSKHFSGLKDYYDGSDGHLLYSVKATKAYYAFLDSGQDLKSYIEQTQGKDAYSKMVQRMGMKLEDGKYDGQVANIDDGIFDQTTADWLMGELDKAIKKSREEYKADNFPNLDLPKDIKPQRSGYSADSSKLPSGSLISVGA